MTELLRLEGLLSRFRPSALTRLNAQGHMNEPPPELLAAVRHALQVAANTRQLVTPTVLPALQAAGYGPAVGTPELPTQPAPSISVPSTAGIRCTEQEIRLPDGVTLDLGGTGKGWIAQQAAQLLHGDAVLDAGGDLVIRQRQAHAVEIEHPQGGPARYLELPAGTFGVATSSVVKRAWAGGHHLIDPRTAQPLQTPLLQVTAVSASVLDAEVLCKLAFFGETVLTELGPFFPRTSLLAFDRLGRWLRWTDRRWEVAA